MAHIEYGRLAGDANANQTLGKLGGGRPQAHGRRTALELCVGALLGAVRRPLAAVVVLLARRVRHHLAGGQAVQPRAALCSGGIVPGLVDRPPGSASAARARSEIHSARRIEGSRPEGRGRPGRPRRRRRLGPAATRGRSRARCVPPPRAGSQCPGWARSRYRGIAGSLRGRGAGRWPTEEADARWVRVAARPGPRRARARVGAPSTKASGVQNPGLVPISWCMLRTGRPRVPGPLEAGQGGVIGRRTVGRWATSYMACRQVLQSAAEVTGHSLMPTMRAPLSMLPETAEPCSRRAAVIGTGAVERVRPAIVQRSVPAGGENPPAPRSARSRPRSWCRRAARRASAWRRRGGGRPARA